MTSGIGDRYGGLAHESCTVSTIFTTARTWHRSRAQQADDSRSPLPVTRSCFATAPGRVLGNAFGNSASSYLLNPTLLLPGKGDRQYAQIPNHAGCSPSATEFYGLTRNASNNLPRAIHMVW